VEVGGLGVGGQLKGMVERFEDRLALDLVALRTWCLTRFSGAFGAMTAFRRAAGSMGGLREGCEPRPPCRSRRRDVASQDLPLVSWP
jgi:hypothetical protein